MDFALGGELYLRGTLEKSKDLASAARKELHVSTLGHKPLL